MKNRKIMAVLIATVMIISMQGCSAKTEETKETSEGTEDTTIETTVETTKTTTESTTETMVNKNSEPVVKTDEDYDFIDWSDMGLSSYVRVPQVLIDSEEIDEMNDKIDEDLYTLIGEDKYIDSYYVGYKVFNGYDGIYSIAIDYSLEGWGGLYSTYTFTEDGHVLSNEEIIGLTGLSESNFFETVKDATIEFMNNSYGPDDYAPLYVNGEVNLDNEFIGSTESEMYQMAIDQISEVNINMDMQMFINDDGKLVVCQAIFPVADYHDCETFYTVPEGEKIDVQCGFQ